MHVWKPNLAQFIRQRKQAFMTVGGPKTLSLIALMTLWQTSARGAELLSPRRKTWVALDGNQSPSGATQNASSTTSKKPKAQSPKPRAQIHESRANCHLLFACLPFPASFR